jgi:hypothetical protein
VATAPLPSLPFLPAGPVPLAEPAVALTPAAPTAAALLPAPLASPLASPTTAHRAPGTDGGEIVIEPIPASTHPANADPALTAARAAADAWRAVLESPAAVQLGDRRASVDAVRLVGVKEEGGKTCREYQQTVMMDGTPVQAVSIVCRQRDGTWKLVE